MLVCLYNETPTGSSMINLANDEGDVFLYRGDEINTKDGLLIGLDLIIVVVLLITLNLRQNTFPAPLCELCSLLILSNFSDNVGARNQQDTSFPDMLKYLHSIVPLLYLVMSGVYLPHLGRASTVCHTLAV